VAFAKLIVLVVPLTVSVRSSLAVAVVVVNESVGAASKCSVANPPPSIDMVLLFVSAKPIAILPSAPRVTVISFGLASAAAANRMAVCKSSANLAAPLPADPS